METEMVECFCDASFDQKLRIGVIGWCIDNNPIKLKTINDTTNTQCECEGVLNILKEITEITEITEINVINKTYKTYIIYTDCESLINNIKNKEKIKNDNYLRKNMNPINNIEIYKQIFEILDISKMKIEFNHIDGHKPTKQKNDLDKKFSKIDKLVRNELRKNVKNNKNI
jgi:ribonuclease HI